VLLCVWAMEAARALAVAAVVSTLAAGLFRGDARVAPTRTMDPSTPWLATCGGGRDASMRSNDHTMHTVAHVGCGSRPTQVVAVQLVLVLGSLLTFPAASFVADADTLGFPFALFVAAAFAPVVAFGYASAGVTHVSFLLIATRLLAGAYKSFNELGQETGVSVAFTPDAKGTPAAFGSRVAAGCVFGIIAPSIVSRAARDVGASRVFDGIAIVGVCVFCVVTVLVVMPAYRHRRDPSADSEKRTENAFFLPVNGAPNDLHREKPSSPETKETKETEPRSSSTEPSSFSSSSPPPSLFASWRELVADGETRLLLFTAMCVGTAEFALEGPVMMALGGVLGFDTSANASFLSAYNVPRGVVSVLAEPILRRVQAQTLAAGGLLSAACGVAWLAALGEKAHESSGTEQTFSATNAGGAFVRLRRRARFRRRMRARLASRSAGAGGGEAEARRAVRRGVRPERRDGQGGGWRGRHGPRGGFGGEARIHRRLRRGRRGVTRGSRRGGGGGRELEGGAREVEVDKVELVGAGG
jgi:hypothetical protein